jgi:hypothetical protein
MPHTGFESQREQLAPSFVLLQGGRGAAGDPTGLALFTLQGRAGRWYGRVSPAKLTLIDGLGGRPPVMGRT